MKEWLSRLFSIYSQVMLWVADMHSLSGDIHPISA